MTKTSERTPPRPASYTHLNPTTPRPQLPPRPQTRPSKPKGLPALGERLDYGSSPEIEDLSPTPTPYRLPKIKADPEDDVYKVWSRHGYDVYTTKPIELEILANHMDTTPRLVSQEMRRANHLSASYPKFREAVISPVHRKPKMYAGNTDPAFYKGMVNRPMTVRTEDSRLNVFEGEGQSSSPLQDYSRCSSPAKSAKSIKWALTPYRNTKIDPKGRTRHQGPFSRQFTVTCAAPSNWLRRKFVRSKTFL